MALTFSGVSSLQINPSQVFSGTLSVSGSLTVPSGHMFIETYSFIIEDDTLTLNSTASGTPTLGAVLAVGSGSKGSCINWNEDTDTWSLGEGSNNAMATLTDLLSALNTLTPPGTILDYAGDTAPTGWLICSGQEVSQTVYSDLYSAIGSSNPYGAASAGMFRLPPAKGVVLVGAPMPSSGIVIGTTSGQVGHSHAFSHTHDFSHNHTLSHTHPVSSAHSLQKHYHTSFVGLINGAHSHLVNYAPLRSLGVYGTGLVKGGGFTDRVMVDPSYRDFVTDPESTPSHTHVFAGCMGNPSAPDADVLAVWDNRANWTVNSAPNTELTGTLHTGYTEVSGTADNFPMMPFNRIIKY